MKFGFKNFNFMPKIFFSTKLFKVLLIVAVSGLLVFLNPGKFFSPVRSFFGIIAYPIQKTFFFLARESAQFAEMISSIGELKEENEKLIKESQQKSAENAMLSDMKKENDLLREQLDLAPRDKFELKAAEVIGYDPQGFGSWLEIDKGKKDGVEKDMPVIVSGGILIGKVDEVFWGNSKVLLITNPQSSINAVVSETEARGVVKGEFGLGLLLDMVLQTDVIQEGDDVITSGIGGGLPRGLLIGKIQEVHSSADKLFQQATVVPVAKFSKLRAVFVIKK